MEEDEIKRIEEQKELVKKLVVNESFQAWIDLIVKPTIAQLEGEIASREADSMPEVILRAKLKHVNSLKMFFEDVFKIL